MMTSHKGSARPLTMGIMLIRRRIHLQHRQLQYMYMYQNNNSCSNHSLWWINKSYFISYKWILPFYAEVYCFLFLSSAYSFYLKKCTSFLQNLIVLLFWYLAISEASVVKKINFVAFEIVDLDTNSCFNKILWSNQQFVKLSWKKILSFIPLSDCPQNGTNYSH